MEPSYVDRSSDYLALPIVRIPCRNQLADYMPEPIDTFDLNARLCRLGKAADWPITLCRLGPVGCRVTSI